MPLKLFDILVRFDSLSNCHYVAPFRFDLDLLFPVHVFSVSVHLFLCPLVCLSVLYLSYCLCQLWRFTIGCYYVDLFELHSHGGQSYRALDVVVDRMNVKCLFVRLSVLVCFYFADIGVVALWPSF